MSAVGEGPLNAYISNSTPISMTCAGSESIFPIHPPCTDDLVPRSYHARMAFENGLRYRRQKCPNSTPHHERLSGIGRKGKIP